MNFRAVVLQGAVAGAFESSQDLFSENIKLNIYLHLKSVFSSDQLSSCSKKIFLCQSSPKSFDKQQRLLIVMKIICFFPTHAIFFGHAIPNVNVMKVFHSFYGEDFQVTSFKFNLSNFLKFWFLLSNFLLFTFRIRIFAPVDTAIGRRENSNLCSRYALISRF